MEVEKSYNSVPSGHAKGENMSIGDDQQTLELNKEWSL